MRDEQPASVRKGVPPPSARTEGQGARRPSLNRLGTHLEVQRLGDGVHDDGGGLRLVVRGPSRVWVFRYTSPLRRGWRRDLGLGALPLKDARARRDLCRAQVSAGHDPIALRNDQRRAAQQALDDAAVAQARQASTLRHVARVVHGKLKGSFRNSKHAAQWLASVESHVPATILDKPIDAVEAGELLDVLMALRDRLPETGSRVRQRLDAVFSYAQLNGMVKGNPAQATTRWLRRKRAERHFAALPYDAVPAFLETLQAYTPQAPAAALALQFALLTAARTGEVLGATWREVDARRREWVIPGARMKAGRQHKVALSDPALRVLARAKALRVAVPKVAPEDLPLFPSPTFPRRPLSNMALLMLLRRLHTGRQGHDGKPESFADRTTVHGLCRTTFSSWARAHTTYRIDSIEAALAHRDEDKVVKAYAHQADYWNERKALAGAWGEFLCGARGNVRQLPTAAA